MHSSLSSSKPLSIAYGTKELPTFIENSRQFHEKRAGSHLPGHLIPVIEANHFTVLDDLRSRDSHLTHALLHRGAGYPGDDSGPGNGAGQVLGGVEPPPGVDSGSGGANSGGDANTTEGRGQQQVPDLAGTDEAAGGKRKRMLMR
jgi:hypothetical protein